MEDYNLFETEGIRDWLYVQVLLPLPLDFIPWYRSEVPLNIGDRVTVRFGSKTLDGVVWSVSDCPDIDKSKVLRITQAGNGLPAVSAEEIELWKFISGYYLCPPGDVFRAAYPKLKVRSERIAASAKVRAELSEKRLKESLQLRLHRIEDRIAKKEAELAGKREGTKIKTNLEESLAKAESELEAVRKALADQDSAPDGNQIIESAEKPRPAGKPVLLEAGNRLPLYIKETEKTLAQGRNVLILVPESGLGESICTGLEGIFRNRMVKYNSQISPAERRKATDAIRSGSTTGGQVIVGTRTALFLPFRKLGLIIVDEEQDTSFKQNEPSPRYNARDCALILGKIHGARVVLGSTAPSLESIYNCLAGKYERILLQDRNCRITTIDIPAERRKHGMDGLFSYKLIEVLRRHPGPVAIIRGWENKVEVEELAGKLFPDKEIKILSASEARRGLDQGTMCAILQADAFFTRDNFRADEHCLQTLSQLASRCTAMTIQTAKSEHPVFALLEATFSGSDVQSAECRMLEERKLFGLPPFTRMLDIHCAFPEDTDAILKRIGPSAKKTAPDTLRIMLLRDSTLPARKAEIARAVRGNRAYLDIDPV